MTDNQPGKAAPDDATGNIEAVPFSVGTVLREARVLHGLSVDEISGRIKFAPRQIEALEADDFAHLPETTFLRGFVRSYARLLELDPVPLLAALPHAPGQAAPLEAKALTEVPFPDIYTERKQNIIWLAAALAVAIALALSAWLLSGKPKEQNPPGATVSGTQNTTVETLALPEAVPVSAVPDTEPAAVASHAEKPMAEKTAAEKAAAEKAAAEKAAAEKAAAEKAAAEKAAAEKAAAEKAAAEKAAAEKAAAEKAAAEKAAAEKAAAEKAMAQKPVTEMKKSVEVKNGPQVAVPPAQAPLLAKPAVKPAAANSVSGHAAIRMTFDAESWVEVKDKDGKILLSQVGVAGGESGVNGTPPFYVTVGYASGVKLYYKGKQIDLAPYARSEVAHLTLE